MSLRPARVLRPAVAVVGALALAAVGGSASLAAAASPGATPAGSATPHLAGRYSDYVNPLIGTSGYVDTFPGPDVPFGMVQLEPDTSPDRPAGGGYEYTDKDLRGFSLTHVSGPGCGAGGDIPMLPVVGARGSGPGRARRALHPHRRGGQGRLLQGDHGHAGPPPVTTTMSTTTRAGISQFAFPGQRRRRTCVLKLDDSATQVDGTRPP